MAMLGTVFPAIFVSHGAPTLVRELSEASASSRRLGEGTGKSLVA